MPQIDDWDYDEWADVAQRGVRAEADQRRYEQSLRKRKQAFEFVELDRQELLESKIRARDAWDAYRADISRQIEQCYSTRQPTETNTPDAEETEGLAYWERDSRLVILAYHFGLAQLLAMQRGKELFESGEGTLISPKKTK